MAACSGTACFHSREPTYVRANTGSFAHQQCTSNSHCIHTHLVTNPKEGLTLQPGITHVFGCSVLWEDALRERIAVCPTSRWYCHTRQQTENITQQRADSSAVLIQVEYSREDVHLVPALR